ncbi:MAG TPA: bifunctional 4-hydroxy-2-oxoglutarate aldolase/2-dehydro-3-deoxy-phosphogluconate aldolase [Candidatus Angelobacter sp.]|jgi:2-dehydro-3-deoxyphosphogluconate aldolase/(4S)-4-hydroxy-2-oxoglutarate aldolase|nr:bifunctional 4-hydroxy-2-oxoglutarate aldolase/2-dehydro-3-deoxy-phosphogluconate aldolase [Candidatus Angelobacter sp.]
MSKAEVRQQIASIGIVPVIRASSAEKALVAVDALREGGIAVVEVTLTVPGAERVIEALRKQFKGDLLVGAGTVLNPESAKRCLDAGAQFIVSPGLNTATIAFVNSQNVLMVAGGLTPTELLAAWESGSDLVKVFPCNAVGGASYIKSLKGPLPQIPFIPTGGVNLQTAADFIRAGSEALGIGSELVPASALDSGKPGVITALAKQFMEIVQEARSSKATATSIR